jgi:hypothetical protein
MGSQLSRVMARTNDFGMPARNRIALTPVEQLSGPPSLSWGRAGPIRRLFRCPAPSVPR